MSNSGLIASLRTGRVKEAAMKQRLGYHNSLLMKKQKQGKHLNG